MTHAGDSRIPRSIVLGTRGSTLARKQADRVAMLLKAKVPDLAIRVVSIGTAGDRDRITPLPEIGRTGLFTAELEDALLSGEIDAAVHSLKDLPLDDDRDLRLGAFPERLDASDVLVSRRNVPFSDLPRKARVGTSSVRRSAQLLARRPDLVIKPIRGNVETRLRKVADGLFDATVLAAAGMLRLGLDQTITERFSWSDLLPAPGQGALAVQYVAHNIDIAVVLAMIDDPRVRVAVEAERSFLRALGGGCSSPIGAIATAETSPAGYDLVLRGIVTGPEGDGVVRVEMRGGDPHEVGYRAAEESLARGAGEQLRRSSSLRPEQMPLRGKRVLVTRPASQAGDLVRLFRNQGARIVVAPMIRIMAELSREAISALNQVEQFDYVVFTSTNTVRTLLDGYRTRISDDQVFRQDLASRAVAVGPATAETLRRFGVEPAIIPAVHRADGLLQVLGDVRGRSIFLPQGEAAGTTFAEDLRTRGATVTHVVIYRTVEADDSETDGILRTELRTEPLDIITFTSGSAARACAAALKRLDHRIGEGPLAETVVACIGPSTASEAEAAGLPVHIVADRHTNEGLLDALVKTRDAPP